MRTSDAMEAIVPSRRMHMRLTLVRLGITMYLMRKKDMTTLTQSLGQIRTVGDGPETSSDIEPIRNLGTNPTEPRAVTDRRMATSGLVGFEVCNALDIGFKAKVCRIVCLPRTGGCCKCYQSTHSALSGHR